MSTAKLLLGLIDATGKDKKIIESLQLVIKQNLSVNAREPPY